MKFDFNPKDGISLKAAIAAETVGYAEVTTTEGYDSRFFWLEAKTELTFFVDPKYAHFFDIHLEPFEAKEVTYPVVAPAPISSTWPLMLLGLIGLGIQRRRSGTLQGA